jgi:hypothetical protein
MPKSASKDAQSLDLRHRVPTKTAGREDIEGNWTLVPSRVVGLAHDLRGPRVGSAAVQQREQVMAGSATQVR